MKKVIKWALDRPLWQAILICIVPAVVFSLVIFFAYALHCKRVEELEQEKARLHLEIETAESTREIEKHGNNYRKAILLADEYRRQSADIEKKLEEIKGSGEEFAKAVKETQSCRKLVELLKGRSQQ